MLVCTKTVRFVRTHTHIQKKRETMKKTTVLHFIYHSVLYTHHILMLYQLKHETHPAVSIRHSFEFISLGQWNRIGCMQTVERREKNRCFESTKGERDKLTHCDSNITWYLWFQFASRFFFFASSFSRKPASSVYLLNKNDSYTHVFQIDSIWLRERERERLNGRHYSKKRYHSTVQIRFYFPFFFLKRMMTKGKRKYIYRCGCIR